MSKNGHNAKAIAHTKYSVSIKKKLPKTCEKRYVPTSALKLFYGKTGS